MLAIPTRREVIDRGAGPVVAVLPIHHPRALLRAMGLVGVEVWGPPGVQTTRGDTHIQAYTCSIVRSGLSFILAEPRGVDAVIVPHGCDSLQGLGSLLLDLAPPRIPVHPFTMPRGEGAGADAYQVAELRALAAALGEPPSDEALHAAIDAEERADAAMAALWADRRALAVDDPTLYRVVRAREYLPPDEFTTLAATLPRGPAPGGVGLVLSGLVPEPAGLLPAIADAGGIVVADDHACCGRRVYRPVVEADPWLRLARRLRSGPPDSTRGSAVSDRARFLVDEAARTGAQAVLFSLVQFCEPELFYLPQVRAALDEAGVASLVVQVDLSVPLPDPVLTRIEALVETVA